MAKKNHYHASSPILALGLLATMALVVVLAIPQLQNKQIIQNRAAGSNSCSLYVSNPYNNYGKIKAYDDVACLEVASFNNYAWISIDGVAQTKGHYYCSTCHGGSISSPATTISGKHTYCAWGWAYWTDYDGKTGASLLQSSTCYISK